LGLSGTRVLRRIFGPKEDEGSRGEYLGLRGSRGAENIWPKRDERKGG